MKKIIIKILSLTLVLLSLGFIVYSFKKLDVGQLKELFTIYWIPFILLSSLFYSLGNILLGFNWINYIIILKNHSINPYKLGMHVYLKTSIAKYLPSNVLHFAGRHLLVEKYDISHKVIAFSTVIEIGSMLFSAATIVFLGFIFGIIKIPEAIIEYIDYKSIIVLLIILSIIIIITLFFLYKNKKLNEITELFNKKSIIKYLSLLLLYFAYFVITGLILTAILFILFKQQFLLNYFIYIILSYILSWLAGYIIPGAPGGFGVREGILILMLSSIFGSTIALTAALLLRVITITGDFMSFSYTIFIFKNTE